MSLLNFTVFHVGGRGGIGEANRVLQLSRNKKNKFKLYVFEADLNDESSDEENKKFIRKVKKRNDVDAEVLEYCIHDHNGEEDFYINVDPRSSSLFKMSPGIVNYSFPKMGEPMWKNHGAVDEIKKVKVSTFDSIRENGLDVVPDLLSMDAQGSELSIMKGSSHIFDNDCLAVCTEVEFREIYKKQPLFSDQDSFLRKNGFIFANFHTVQEWFPSKLMIGKPFYTVGEVTFLKDYVYLMDKYKNDLETLIPLMFKLAVISKALFYTSYTFIVLDSLYEMNTKAYKLFVKNSSDKIVIDVDKFYKENLK